MNEYMLELGLEIRFLDFYGIIGKRYCIFKFDIGCIFNFLVCIVVEVFVYVVLVVIVLFFNVFVKLISFFIFLYLLVWIIYFSSLENIWEGI